jgi:hypothetical protein
MARVAIMVFGVGGANTGTGHNQDVLNVMKSPNSSFFWHEVLDIIVGGHHEYYPLVQIIVFPFLYIPKGP